MPRALTADGEFVGQSETYVEVGGVMVPVTAANPMPTSSDLAKAEDAAHSSGDVGVQVLGVRNDADAARTSANGDYSPISVDDAGRVKVLPAAQEAHLGQVGGHTAIIGTEIIRPANTTAYAAKDIVSDGNPITFTNAARINAGSGTIILARLLTDQKTNTARYRLHLYATIPGAIADNDPMLLLYANAAIRLGALDFPALATEDPTNSTAANALNNDVRIPFVCGAGSRNIFGLLETLDAIAAPASQQKYYVGLGILQD